MAFLEFICMEEAHELSRRTCGVFATRGTSFRPTVYNFFRCNGDGARVLRRTRLHPARHRLHFFQGLVCTLIAFALRCNYVRQPVYSIVLSRSFVAGYKAEALKKRKGIGQKKRTG